MKFEYWNTFCLIGIGLLFLVTACDPCKDVTCKNGEPKETENNECRCNCDAGYEGDQCGRAMNAKFEGDYKVSDTCGSYVYGYNATVRAVSGSPSNIEIDNFGSLQVTVSGHVQHDTIIVPEQTVSDFHFDRSEGKMNDKETQFVITYSYTSQSQPDDTCTALYMLQ